MQNMTHCYLRAMSPIHLKCMPAVLALECSTDGPDHRFREYGYTGVYVYCTYYHYLAGTVVTLHPQSIIAFGRLWGLVACHSYGAHGMRVSFPVRQMLRLLSQSISRNVERLTYAQRLRTRQLVRVLHHPRLSGGEIYI
jgi:hypothetical protein